MIRYFKNEEHYDLLLEQMAKVKHTLWIGTADLKDLYVKKEGKAVPFFALLDEKVRQGVDGGTWQQKKQTRLCQHYGAVAGMLALCTPVTGK